jgi:hypothetical protein
MSGSLPVHFGSPRSPVDADGRPHLHDRLRGQRVVGVVAGRVDVVGDLEPVIARLGQQALGLFGVVTEGGAVPACRGRRTPPSCAVEGTCALPSHSASFRRSRSMASDRARRMRASFSLGWLALKMLMWKSGVRAFRLHGGVRRDHRQLVGGDVGRNDALRRCAERSGGWPLRAHAHGGAVQRRCIAPEVIDGARRRCAARGRTRPRGRGRCRPGPARTPRNRRVPARSGRRFSDFM